MKRMIGILSLCALVLCLAAGCGAGEETTVSVESVSLITGVGAVGAVDSYAGKVVSGETAELKKDEDKTVLEVRVAEGDMVEAGDVLFSYDMEALQLSLDKLILDKESYENTIAAAETEIAELEKLKASASSSQQLSYTLQIDSRSADIREAEYNIALKEKEIAAMQTALENTDVCSPISGRVMSVKDEQSGQDMSDTSGAFITVMDVSAYRVEGQINEMNLYSLTEGMGVIIRSRVDENTTWTGTIQSIDWENPVKNTNNYYYDGAADDMTSSSKYPFYVVLDSTEGLLLGQHVYIEPDYGQDGDTNALMLPSWYVVADGAETYVWAADDRDRLEKRTVTLGEYDEMSDTYEILSGLTTEDYIAFPEDTLTAGTGVSYFDENSFSGGDEEYYEDDMYAGDGDGIAVVSEPFVAAEG